MNLVVENIKLKSKDDYEGDKRALVRKMYYKMSELTRLPDQSRNTFEYITQTYQFKLVTNRRNYCAWQCQTRLIYVNHYWPSSWYSSLARPCRWCGHSRLLSRFCAGQRSVALKLNIILNSIQYTQDSCSLVGVSGVPEACRNHTYFSGLEMNNGVSVCLKLSQH